PPPGDGEVLPGAERPCVVGAKMLDAEGVGVLPEVAGFGEVPAEPHRPCQPGVDVEVGGGGGARVTGSNFADDLLKELPSLLVVALETVIEREVVEGAPCVPTLFSER